MEKRIIGTYNETGEYTGFYHTDIWDIDDIPTPNIEVTEEQWNKTFDVRCLVVDGVHTEFPMTEQEINDSKMAALRIERDKLLRESDWTQMVSDIPLSDVKKEEWRVYRQELRDLPKTVDLSDIIYPTKPL